MTQRGIFLLLIAARGGTPETTADAAQHAATEAKEIEPSPMQAATASVAAGSGGRAASSRSMTPVAAPAAGSGGANAALPAATGGMAAASPAGAAALPATSVPSYFDPGSAPWEPVPESEVATV